MSTGAAGAAGSELILSAALLAVSDSITEVTLSAGSRNAGDGTDEFIDRGVRCLELCDIAPETQHHNPIGNLEDVGHVVADENH